MARGKKTGGRNLGTTNKATSTLNEQVEQAAGGEPLPVLLTRIGMIAMERKDFQTAINALSKAAAYVYPRLSAIDPATGSSPINLQINAPSCSCGKDHITIVREVMTRPVPPSTPS